MADDKSLKWWSDPRTLLRHVLMLDDTPHHIAMGVAVGIFIGMTPTVGVQMILVMIFAFLSNPLFQFNRVAALITVYISNPITMIPIYWFDYKVGTFFVEGTVSRDEFQQIFEYDGFTEWWATIVGLVVDIGWPLAVGTAVVSTVSGVVSYPVILWLVRSFHHKHSSQEQSPPSSKQPTCIVPVDSEE
jgi:uncharacterized protein (DUF2062 family)